MNRRTFLAAPALAGLAGQIHAATPERRVVATGDGIAHSAVEYASLLDKLAAQVKPDSYSLGGVVTQLEEKVAAVLGKETAVWLPTGTLANHLAVRILAGEKRRVLVQKECHLYNDCGDCCETLSGLNMIPLSPGRATFTLEEVQQEAERAASGRVAVPIGALQIETPVRRKTGEAFDLAEMRRITEWARAQKIGLHLDGARLFLAAGWSGVPVREYANLFDTVYVSMYKYFNAASGAVLAGPKSLLANLFQTRRMFGGGLNQVWPFAAVALHYFEGFEERYGRAVACAKTVIAGLEGDRRFEVNRVPNGTNLIFLRVKGVDAAMWRHRLAEAGLNFGAPQGDRFTVSINETWNEAAPQEILGRMQRALG